jgi:hypothetical protein
MHAARSGWFTSVMAGFAAYAARCPQVALNGGGQGLASRQLSGVLRTDGDRTGWLGR